MPGTRPGADTLANLDAEPPVAAPHDEADELMSRPFQIYEGSARRRLSRLRHDSVR
jgi:hypothetical protein